MPAYRTDVATLDIPASWQDQSIIAFRLPAASGGVDASFVITKDASKGVTPFEAYLDKQIDNCRRSLPGYTEVKRERFEANDRDCAWLEFDWNNDSTPIRIRQIYFDCGFFVTICTLTAAPGEIAYHEAEWRRAMASLTFDAPAPAPAFP